MSTFFKEVTLGEVCLVGDGAHSKVTRTQSGIMYLTSKNIGQGFLKLDKIDYITIDSFDKLFPKSSNAIKRPQAGDILFGIIGTFGNLYLYKENDLFGFSSSIGILRPNKEKISSEYLYHVMNGEDFKNNHSALNAGSVQGYTNIATVKSLRIPLPSLNVQKNIAKILTNFDKKIHLNNQINQNLESMAQAMFKSWFIDFDPVRAKIAAKQDGKDSELAAMCAISGKSEAEIEQMVEDDLAELRATASLFPDELMESELGEVPKGWQVGCVGDIATAKGGYAFKGSQFAEKGYPVIKIKNITGDGKVDIQGTQCIDEKTARIAAKFMLHDCDLVMAMTGATVGKIGLVNTYGKSVYLNQRVAKFESEKFGGKISYFLFCLFNRKEYFEQIVGTAQGSAQPNISSSGIESISIIVPNFELINLFINNTDSIFQYWLKNGSTNNFLNQIRDTLLPKLLSGEVELTDFITEDE